MTVVIPTYNSSETLSRAIESVFSQSYPNMELIVIDDGSEDDGATENILSSYGDRLRFVRTKNNGVAAARNRGIDEATGEYIAFLDADDAFTPHKIERQIAHMRIHGFKFCHSSYRRIDEQTGAEKVVSTAFFTDRVFPHILFSCGVATPTVVAERAILSDHRFKEDIHIGEDICLWIDLAYLYSFGQIDEPLTDVYTDEGSAALAPEKQLIGFQNILRHILSREDYACHFPEVELLLKDMLFVNYCRYPEDVRKQYSLYSALRRTSSIRRMLVEIGKITVFRLRIIFAWILFFLNPVNYYLFIKKQVRLFRERRKNKGAASHEEQTGESPKEGRKETNT